MVDSALARKVRGAFFTPPEVARFIAEWAIRTPSDHVLEPSSGEAVFMLEAAQRLRSVGGLFVDFGTQLRGIEIDPASAITATKILSEAGLSATVSCNDFFDEKPVGAYDAVIGNPPYIRYQNFSGESRLKGLQAALAQGVRLTGLASSWAAFTVHAAQFLKPSGRLGLVLPAELLSVSYASQIRRFLLERFKSVKLVLFEELVFPGVLTEAVVLLAEGTGGAPSFEVYQARNAAELASIEASRWTGFTPEAGEKWTSALLPPSALGVYKELTRRPEFETLLRWGETYLGAVTGNNGYFTLSTERVLALGLKKRELTKISPPGSRHLRGLTFSEGAWCHLADDGHQCWLFTPGESPSANAQRYIELGEQKGVQKAYKCKMRKPWWRVSLVSKPDLLLTYMNHERPRLIANVANVSLLNSLYGVLLRPGRKRIGQRLLPLASLNSVSLLGAEIVGRSYGGGILKMEPKEADRIPVPSLAMLKRIEHDLTLLRPQVSDALRQNKLDRAVKIVDGLVLKDTLGLGSRELEALRMAREFLFQRRVIRGRSDGYED